MLELTKKNEQVSYLLGLLCLAMAQIMVGFNIVYSKFIVSSIPLLLLLTIRFAAASVVLLPLHWLTPGKKKSLKTLFSALTKRDWIFIFAQAITAGILFNALMLLGLRYTDANVAGIITSALPAMIAIMSWLILKESFTGKTALCIALASLGLIIIALDKFKGVGAGHSFIGDLIVFSALIPEASYYILCKLYQNKLPIFIASSLLNAIVFGLLFLIVMAVGVPPLGGIDANGWLLLILLGLSSGLFYVFWFYGCQRVDGIMSSLSTGIMPVSAVMIAWMVLGERLSVLECLGMALVLLSIATYAKR
jgi:drug/metabolite transporter (DMT)-like permease